MSLEKAVEKRVEIIRQGRCDGAVYHMNRSCKVMDFTTYEGSGGSSPRRVPLHHLRRGPGGPAGLCRRPVRHGVQPLVEMMEAGRRRSDERREADPGHPGRAGRVAARPGEAAQRLTREKGKPLVGVLPYYAPEEIAHAAGMLPWVSGAGRRMRPWRATIFRPLPVPW